MKLYKYIGSNVLDLAFSKDGYVGFKCSYPKDYNDPYELFLTIDADKVEPEVAAYYLEILGNVPQLPTTCFSNLPNVIPMWAHYAGDSKGFVIEVDEDAIRKIIPDVSIADVDYEDEPIVVPFDLVTRAYHTGKPRHTYFLQRAAFSRTYFNKNSCWSYEAERRLLVTEKEITKIAGHMILYLPVDFVTAIIAGPRSTEDMKTTCKQICENISCEYFEMIIGRSSIKPFFISTTYTAYIFDGQGLVIADNYCEECGEPIYDENVFKCPWCAIDETQERHAAFRNPMRMLAKYDLLKGYIQMGEEIRKKYKTD